LKLGDIQFCKWALGALEQNSDLFRMSVLVTKLHFIAMAFSIVIIGIILV